MRLITGVENVAHLAVALRNVASSGRFQGTTLRPQHTSSITKTLERFKIARAIHRSCFSLYNPISTSLGSWGLTRTQLRSFHRLPTLLSPNRERRWHLRCLLPRLGYPRTELDGHDEGIRTKK